MAYHTPIYLFLFLPLAVLCYAVCPKRHRYKVLLLFSCLFFYSISRKLLLYLIAATFVAHDIGLWLDALHSRCAQEREGLSREQKKARKAVWVKRERGVLLLGIVLLVGCLAYLKYYNFYAVCFDAFLNQHGIGGFRFPVKQIAVPIGVSFYTLQAIGYMTDVYRGTIHAETNFARLLLFMGFFPQLMEGPICRYGETAEALFAGEPIRWKNLCFGCQRILWGLFKKLVIADRLNILVKTVFDDYGSYGGAVIAAAAVSYTIQLYMEFSGAIDIVIGSAEIFGVKLPENFRQPFFSRSASEFWRRWHISLGAWFRDYIFYPVSMSGAMKKWNKWGRAHVGEYLTRMVLTITALFPVWLCNGLWHGANWTYLFYGMYYFVIITLENMLEPAVQRVLTALHTNRENKIYHGLQIIKTLFIVFVGELFFRAPSLAAGKEMLFRIFQTFDGSAFWDGTMLTLGMDEKDFLIAGCASIVVLLADLWKKSGASVREWIAARRLPVRWGICYAALFSVIIFGAYGAGYTPVDLIYAGF